MYKSSDFWRESQVALRTELYHKFWDLNTYWKAWLIATMETDADIKLVIDEFGQVEED